MVAKNKKDKTNLNIDVFKQIINSFSGYMVFIVDSNLKMVYMNPQFDFFLHKYFNHSKNDNNLLDILSLRSGRDTETVFKHVLRGHEENDYLMLDSNTKMSPKINLLPIGDELPYTFFTGIIEDFEGNFIENNKGIKTYNALLNALPDAILIVNSLGLIKNYSNYCNKLFSIEDSSSLLNKNIIDFVSPKDKEIFDEQIKQLGDTNNTNREITFITYDGDRFVGQVNTSILGNDGNLGNLSILVIRDIGRYREKLETTKQKMLDFKKMLEFQPSYVWSTKIYENGQELFSYVSPIVESITGYPKDFFHKNPREILNIVHPEDQQRVAEYFEELYGAYNNILTIEFRIIHSDKNIRWLRSESVIEYMSTGFRQIISTTSDITKEKKTEILLEKSEKKYRLISENTKNVIWTIDTNHKITFISPSVYPMTGFKPDDIINGSITLLFSESTIEKIKKLVYSIKEEEHSKNEPILFQTQYKKKDGVDGWCELKLSLMMNNGNPEGIQGSFVDITSRKEIESALINEQKLAIDFLLASKTLFISTDNDGNIIKSNGDNFLKISNEDLLNTTIIKLLDTDNICKPEDLFENESDICDKQFNNENWNVRIFGKKLEKHYDFVVFDHTQLHGYRNNAIENLSMIQLILWS